MARTFCVNGMEDTPSRGGGKIRRHTRAHRGEEKTGVGDANDTDDDEMRMMRRRMTPRRSGDGTGRGRGRGRGRDGDGEERRPRRRVLHGVLFSGPEGCRGTCWSSSTGGITRHHRHQNRHQPGRRGRHRGWSWSC